MPAPALPVIIALWCCLAAAASAQSNSQAETEIRAVIQAQQQAWNRGDFEQFMNGYARSADTVFVSGDEITRGWQTVRDRYARQYSDREKMGELIFSELEIRLLANAAAAVTGRWELKRANDHPHGRFTLVFCRLLEGWRIVQDHTSSAP